MRETKLYIFVLLSLLLLCTSCGTTKRLPAGVKSAKELSEAFGFKVTDKNNLHLYTEAQRWLGVKYRSGGNSHKGVDCSGFVWQIYNNVYGKRLTRSSAGMLKDNCWKIRKKDLREGDLVFFSIRSGRKKVANHVGIYLKSDYFVHASTSKGVRVDKLTDSYYKKYWLCGGRLK